MGDRVLVTAQASKALKVLRDDLLPGDVRDLCVTALGSSREDQRLLEESVRGILRRKNEWLGPEHAQHAIDQTEKRLLALDGELAKVERFLRESREAETHPHTLPGGYQGTAAQIAQKVHEQREQFSWFPDSRHTECTFPLDTEDANFLADVHPQLDSEALDELQMEVGAAQLPEPNQFGELIATLVAAEESATKATSAAAPEKVEALGQSPPESLSELRSALETLEGLTAKATRVLGDVTETILADFLVGSVERWARLLSESDVLLAEATALLGQLGTTSVELPPDVHQDRLRTDAQRRFAYFEEGGRRGFSIFSPRLVKETRYVTEVCRVDGRKPDSVEQLASVVAFLKVKQNIQALERLWVPTLPELSDPRQAVTRAQDLTNELRSIVQFFDAKHAASISGVLQGDRTSLSASSERQAWLEALLSEFASRAARSAQENLARIMQEP